MPWSSHSEIGRGWRTCRDGSGEPSYKDRAADSPVEYAFRDSRGYHLREW